MQVPTVRSTTGSSRGCVRASVACAAIDERAPDAPDFDRPLKLQDVVLARLGGCSLKAGFARCDPAFGYGIVPLAEIDHVRFSSFQSPRCLIAYPWRLLLVFWVRLPCAACSRIFCFSSSRWPLVVSTGTDGALPAPLWLWFSSGTGCTVFV